MQKVAWRARLFMQISQRNAKLTFPLVEKLLSVVHLGKIEASRDSGEMSEKRMTRYAKLIEYICISEICFDQRI